MKVFKAYKTELKPNNKQITFFNQCSGTSRYVYNWGLAEWKKEYESGGKPSQYGLCVKFNSLKDEICPWIREYPYAITESAFSNLNNAFKNFFRRLKTCEKSGYPKFKNKFDNKSFQVRGTKIQSDKIKITGIGWIRLKQHNYIPINVDKYGVYATISEQASKWFVSILVEEEMKEVILEDNIIGIDLGIKNIVVTSDEEYFDTPKDFIKYDKKLKKIQRELSRRTKGSKNYSKTKKKLSKIHAKISNSRKNTLHEITTSIVNKNPKAIIIENLNVKGMVKNHNIARSLANSSFGEIRRQFTYKSAWKKIDLIFADRFEPSSKKCSNCGNIKDTLNLSDRTYKCENCGYEIDRDLNAAINLKNLYKYKEPLNEGGLSGELV